MANIKEDITLKNQFVERLQERCAPARKEIHVSDLTWCLRKAYYRRFQNKKLTPEQLMFFLEGHQRHEGIQSLLGNSRAVEQEVTKYGVVGHLDLLGNYPIEIKSTRSQPGKRINETHLRQLAYYCLLTDSNVCSLITQYIEDNLITFEQISFSKLELDQYLRDMIEARDVLQFAYDRKSPAQLPMGQEWQCRNCEFKGTCDKS
jgi:CRISPR/Cas system-associated exonuclease Cas4 (RecB family)